MSTSKVQAGKTRGRATATLLCRGAATVSGRCIKSTHSWQDTELPNVDPQECEGIHERPTHTVEQKPEECPRELGVFVRPPLGLIANHYPL